MQPPAPYTNCSSNNNPVPVSSLCTHFTSCNGGQDFIKYNFNLQMPLKIKNHIKTFFRKLAFLIVQFTKEMSTFLVKFWTL